MLLYTYFQKKHQVPRREYVDMLKQWAIFLNKQAIEWFEVEIQIWDVIDLKLPDGSTFTEEVKFFPWFAPKIVLFHKPKWYVCSKEDKHNKTIYEILPDSRIKDFRYIWRLDKESTWLLLLTNDSKLVDYYENPFHDVHKVYEVQIDKPLRSNDVKKMRKWIYVSAEWERRESQDQLTTDLLKCVWVRYSRIEEKHFAIITLNEGKNRHIRRLMKALWYRVKKLHRLKVGKRHISDIRPWKWKIEKAVIRLRKSEKERSPKKKKKNKKKAK